MGRRRNAVGLARAVWLQRERERARQEAPRPATRAQLIAPSEWYPVLEQAGAKYTDFTVVQCPLIDASVAMSWRVHHRPSGQHRVIGMTHIQAHVLPHGDLRVWVARQVFAAADEILDSMPKRTM